MPDHGDQNHCEACGGTGKSGLLGKPGPPFSCPRCLGSGRKLAHEAQDSRSIFDQQAITALRAVGEVLRHHIPAERWPLHEAQPIDRVLSIELARAAAIEADAKREVEGLKALLGVRGTIAFPPGPPPDLGSALMRLGQYLAAIGPDAAEAGHMIATELSQLLGRVRELEQEREATLEALGKAPGVATKVLDRRFAEIVATAQQEEREACALGAETYAAGAESAETADGPERARVARKIAELIRARGGHG